MPFAITLRVGAHRLVQANQVLVAMRPLKHAEYQGVNLLEQLGGGQGVAMSLAHRLPPDIHCLCWRRRCDSSRRPFAVHHSPPFGSGRYRSASRARSNCCSVTPSSSETDSAMIERKVPPSSK